MSEEAERALYALLPSGFVAARDALAKSLRAAGARDEAARVKRLPRPSSATWAVNQLGRRAPDALLGYLEAHHRARERQLRALTAPGDREQAGLAATAARVERRQLDELLDQARALLDDAGLPATRTTLDRIRTNLRAAVVTPDTQARLEGGWLPGDLEEPGFEALAAALRDTRPDWLEAEVARLAARRAEGRAETAGPEPGGGAPARLRADPGAAEGRAATAGPEPDEGATARPRADAPGAASKSLGAPATERTEPDDRGGTEAIGHGESDRRRPARDRPVDAPPELAGSDPFRADRRPASETRRAEAEEVALERAETRLARAEASRTKAEAARAQAEAATAEAEAARAQAEATRREAEAATAEAAARHEETETARAEAEASLAGAEDARGAAEARVAALRAELRAAEADLEAAEAAVLERRTTLADRRAEAEATLQARDEARRHLDAARAEVEAARAQITTARVEIDAARAEADAARAEADAARADVEAIRRRARGLGPASRTRREDIDRAELRGTEAETGKGGDGPGWS